MNLSVLEDFACFTTNSVVNEVRSTFSKQKIDTALLVGNLKIQDPKPESISYVKTVAQTSGDLVFLSTTDIDIIALAHEFRTNTEENITITVVTDDYSIQNVLTLVKISVHSFLKKGVRSYIQWEIFCPHCKTIYTHPKTADCVKCGVKLKRRPIKNNKDYFK